MVRLTHFTLPFLALAGLQQVLGNAENLDINNKSEELFRNSRSARRYRNRGRSRSAALLVPAGTALNLFLGITGFIFGAESFFDSEVSCDRIHQLRDWEWRVIRSDLRSFERRVKQGGIKQIVLDNFNKDNERIKRDFVKKRYKGYYWEFVNSYNQAIPGSRKQRYNKTFEQLVKMMEKDPKKWLCSGYWGSKPQASKYDGFVDDLKEMMAETATMVREASNNMYK